MKKILSIIVLVILSFVIGNGTQDAGMNVAKADTPVTGPPLDGGTDGSGMASDNGCQ